MIRLLRQQHSGRRIPEAVKKKIHEIENRCIPCNKNPVLLRVPKVAISHSATPNISVSIDLMHHKIEGKNVSFLTILDLGYSMFKLGYIRDS